MLKNKSVMLGIMYGKGRRGRPNREWIDDIKEWCNKSVQLDYICTRLKIVETNDEICVGHLRAFSPWVMMMICIVVSVLNSNRDVGVKIPTWAKFGSTSSVPREPSGFQTAVREVRGSNQLLQDFLLHLNP